MGRGLPRGGLIKKTADSASLCKNKATRLHRPLRLRKLQWRRSWGVGGEGALPAGLAAGFVRLPLARPTQIRIGIFFFICVSAVRRICVYLRSSVFH
ncbi:MAG: hypothetical protein H7Z12_06925 [Rhodospirillaceae bacterium]|nr:hypothetical protein [Rhodospirillales bacterium]